VIYTATEDRECKAMIETLSKKGDTVPITSTAIIDASVVRRAQEGNADAFETIFHAHKTRVYYLCLRMTKNVAEAEDLTQDVFMHIFRKLSSFRGDSALSTWLYRVAVNTVLMHFRKKSLPEVSLDNPRSDQNGKATVREFRSKDLCLAGCVDRITLRRVLEQLPDGYRTIFLLHEVDGYEHQEIAALLGCSIGNSKSQLHKARQQIKRALLQSSGKTHATLAVGGSKSTSARSKTSPLADREFALAGSGPSFAPQLAGSSA
jgi:RNA polymerase sigma-70 factor (ECF subfamily)